MAKIEKTGNTMCLQGCGTTLILIHCWWKYKIIQLFQKLSAFNTGKNTSALPAAFWFQIFPKTNKYICPGKDLYKNIHHSYNS